MVVPFLSTVILCYLDKDNMYEDGEYEFVEPLLDEFKCPVTLGVLTEPYQTTCGHYLSKDVATKFQQCPVCRTAITLSIPDQSMKRKVYALQVYCQFKKRGCLWSGAMSDMKQHLQKCNYLQIECPSKCGKVVRLGRLDEHKNYHCLLRPFNCAYCGHFSNYQEIINSHQPDCALQVIQCTNKCADANHIQRQHMSDHLKCCPYEIINCEYYFAGCLYRCKRCDMKQHIVDVKHHLNLLASHKHQVIPRLKELYISNEHLISSAHVSGQIYSPPPEFEIDNFLSFYHDCTPRYSDYFYSDFGGHKLNLKIYTNGCAETLGSHICIAVNVVKGEFDGDICYPFCGEVTIQLCSHSKPSSVYERKFQFSDLKDHQCIEQEFIAIEEILRPENNYLKGSKLLIFRVSNIVVKPKVLVPAQRSSSIWTGFLHVGNEQLLEHIAHFPNTVVECDCCAIEAHMQYNSDKYLPALTQYIKIIHTMAEKFELQNKALQTIVSKSVIAFKHFPEFTMNNFMRYHDRDRSWLSTPFFSHYGGYKLRLRVDGYGYGSRLGTHLCVVINLMKGPFDDFLKFPFYGAITVQLVDQSSKNKHYESVIEFHDKHPEFIIGRPKRNQNEGLGELNFFPLKKLFSNDRYLKNNSLRLKITRIIVKS